MSKFKSFFQESWAAISRQGPAVHADLWPKSLSQSFPGRRHLIESWHGEGASFARYKCEHGPLFLKYIPFGNQEPRAYKRFEREITYLRDLAPLAPVPYALHLHSQLDAAQQRAHLLLTDLTEETYGWGHFQSFEEQNKALHDVVRLLAQFHAFWAGTDGRGHSHLSGDWKPKNQGHISFRLPDQPPHEVQEAQKQLSTLIAQTRTRSLVHGDIHSGQVAWPKNEGSPYLIDYGQIHPGIPGEDWAHLLYVRIGYEQRQLLAPALRKTYLNALKEYGLDWDDTELLLQERAGMALNLLSTAQQLNKQPPVESVTTAYQSLLEAWETSQIA